ncbi:MAG: YqaJ viral recombinase family protein [Calditerrivibrio sp.]|nr:YqaJ viral recombinase family protein [Calditerrivibrio sp.]
MKTLLFNSREEWLNNRLVGIGASEIPIIMGVSPYMTPYKLWRIKKGLDAPEQNKYMEMGVRLEHVVAEMFYDATGYKSYAPFDGFAICYMEDKPHIMCSPDRLYTNDLTHGILEIKTTQYSINEIEELLPLHWYMQVIYQFGIMRDIADEAYIAYLCRGIDFGYKKIEFDEELFNTMVEKANEFYFKYIEGNEIPEITENDVNDVYNYSLPGTSVKANEDIITLVNQLSQLKEEKKELDTKIESLENKIKLFMADNELLVDDSGRVLVTWKQSKPSESFDKEKFKEQHPDLYQKFVKINNPTRPFIVKKSKQ